MPQSSTTAPLGSPGNPVTTREQDIAYRQQVAQQQQAQQAPPGTYKVITSTGQVVYRGTGETASATGGNYMINGKPVSQSEYQAAKQEAFIHAHPGATQIGVSQGVYDKLSSGGPSYLPSQDVIINRVTEEQVLGMKYSYITGQSYIPSEKSYIQSMTPAAPQPTSRAVGYAGATGPYTPAAAPYTPANISASGVPVGVSGPKPGDMTYGVGPVRMDTIGIISAGLKVYSPVIEGVTLKTWFGRTPSGGITTGEIKQDFMGVAKTYATPAGIASVFSGNPLLLYAPLQIGSVKESFKIKAAGEEYARTQQVQLSAISQSTSYMNKEYPANVTYTQEKYTQYLGDIQKQQSDMAKLGVTMAPGKSATGQDVYTYSSKELTTPNIGVYQKFMQSFATPEGKWTAKNYGYYGLSLGQSASVAIGVGAIGGVAIGGLGLAPKLASIPAKWSIGAAVTGIGITEGLKGYTGYKEFQAIGMNPWSGAASEMIRGGVELGGVTLGVMATMPKVSPGEFETKVGSKSYVQYETEKGRGIKTEGTTETTWSKAPERIYRTNFESKTVQFREDLTLPVYDKQGKIVNTINYPADSSLSYGKIYLVDKSFGEKIGRTAEFGGLHYKINDVVITNPVSLKQSVVQYGAGGIRVQPGGLFKESFSMSALDISKSYAVKESPNLLTLYLQGTTKQSTYYGLVGGGDILYKTVPAFGLKTPSLAGQSPSEIVQTISPTTGFSKFTPYDFSTIAKSSSVVTERAVNIPQVQIGQITNLMAAQAVQRDVAHAALSLPMLGMAFKSALDTRTLGMQQIVAPTQMPAIIQSQVMPVPPIPIIIEKTNTEYVTQFQTITQTQTITQPGPGAGPAISPPMFGMPGFSWHLPSMGPGFGAVRRQTKRRYSYTPSYTALQLNIRGPQPTKKVFSGFEMRPISPKFSWLKVRI